MTASGAFPNRISEGTGRKVHCSADAAAAAPGAVSASGLCNKARASLFVLNWPNRIWVHTHYED